MIIHRLNRKNYTTVSNEVVDDARLSYEALGLLTYLLSRPEDWQVHIDQLRERVKIGRDKLYRIVGELQAAGYMKHERERSRGVVTGGHWIVREEPTAEVEQDSTIEAETEPNPEKPEEAESPHPEKPLPAEPLPAFQDAYKGLTDTNSGQVPKDERDAGARAREAEPHIPDAELLGRLTTAHPGAAQDSVPDTEAAWRALDRPERREAVARFAEWLENARSLGRGRIAGLPAYLREKRWQKLPAKEDISELYRAIVEPFSRAWWWLFHDFVRRYRAALASRGSPESRELTRMIGLAAGRVGWKIDPDKRMGIEESARALKPVPRDGAEAAEIVAAYRAIGVSMPLPDKAEWIFVPAEFRTEVEEQESQQANG